MITQEELKQRIETALETAECGSFDGSHHKMWVIDQMVRALTGSKPSPKMVRAPLEPTTEYHAWVKQFCDGSDGPNTYEWDAGIAP